MRKGWWYINVGQSRLEGKKHWMIWLSIVKALCSQWWCKNGNHEPNTRSAHSPLLPFDMYDRLNICLPSKFICRNPNLSVMRWSLEAGPLGGAWVMRVGPLRMALVPTGFFVFLASEDTEDSHLWKRKLTLERLTCVAPWSQTFQSPKLWEINVIVDRVCRTQNKKFNK